jgi:hypothetical protein
LAELEQLVTAEYVSTNGDCVPYDVHNDLQARLLDGAITPYDMADFCKENPDVVVDGLRASLTSHESPYVRLCSAWSLGEIGNPMDMPLLQHAYKLEGEDNVRTNIAWAQFMIDTEQIGEENFRDFLLDDYYVIPLVAVKRLSGMPHLAGKYDFSRYYEAQENQLVSLEMLRNIRSFQISEDINAKLGTELKGTENLLDKSALIKAIGATNQIDSMATLMDYYHEFKENILGNELLADAMVSAFLSLGQSDPYEILQEIYAGQTGQAIRWKIIESLAGGSGPRSLDVLRNIHGYERDPNIKDVVRSFIDMTRVTIS